MRSELLYADDDDLVVMTEPIEGIGNTMMKRKIYRRK